MILPITNKNFKSVLKNKRNDNKIINKSVEFLLSKQLCKENEILKNLETKKRKLSFN